MAGGVDPISVDSRVRTVDGARLQGAVRLPELEGVEPVRDPVFDTIGRLAGTNPLLTFGAGGAGLLLGAGIGRGVLGAMGVTRGAELVSGRGSPSSDADVARPAMVAAHPRTGATGERVKVMDWNVRELIGSDGTFRTDDGGIDAIAQVVARERPDVLVLQEVSQGSVLGGFADDLDELADRLGATDAVLVPNGLRASGKAKGQAVLTFGDARVQDARGLRHPDPLGDGIERRLRGSVGPLAYEGVQLPSWSRPTYQPRTTADVVVTTAGGTDVRVLDVHLSGGSRQLDDVAGTLDAWRGPTLVVGDFNVLAGAPAHEHEQGVLRRGGLRDAFEQVGVAADDPSTRSFPAVAADRSIDRLYSSDELRVTDARVLDDATSRAGSDHLPLVAELVVE